ncbi:MAG: ABC transporter substrate-binding protein [Desulfobacterales bacterium]|nr:ABC transporter substrate-binding protein [Desulfobacterales bacterium]
MTKWKQLEAEHKKGRITRREFIQRAAALGITLTAFSGLTPPSLFASEGPKKGGRFRMGVSGASTTETLAITGLSGIMMENVVYGQLGNSLLEIDANGNIGYELATSYEASPDAKNWTFKLQKGVTFHNGKSLTAEDVIHSINLHRGSKSKSAAKAIAAPIENIVKVDPWTVRFELNGPNADFPFTLTDYHMVIVPEGSDGSDGIFTGPYKLKELKPGVRVLATRNENYFQNDRGWFDEVETLGINDANARINALKTGQVDVIDRCELKMLRFLERTPGLQIIKGKGYKHFSFPMLTDQSPFSDNNVRMALKHAVDREQLVKAVFRGYAAVGNDHPISPANRYHATDLPQRAYDPDKAKFYLKKAGLSRLEVPLHVADTAFMGAVDSGLLFRESAAKAGIDLKVVREPEDGYWSNVWLKKPFCACFWAGRAVEDMMFTTAYAAGAPWNDTRWAHPRFNELLVAARGELDKTKRQTMYTEMQQLLRDEGGVIIPAFGMNIAVASSKVKFNSVAPNLELDGLRASQRWWFK